MKLIKRICFFTILLSLFTMSAESQNNIKKYDAAWKKVEEFSKKNLPKSALAEVKKIYDMASKDSNLVCCNNFSGFIDCRYNSPIFL